MAEFKPIPTTQRFKDQTGRQVGIFVVLGYTGVKSGRHRWLCRCRCGREWEVDAKWIKRGHSCGCAKKHGMCSAPEFAVWGNMKRRCHSQKHEQYKDYGGRGIFVCERWRTSFLNFITDMGPRPTSGHTIERNDNDGPYSPENCRWATRIEQARNRRDCHFHELFGRKMILTDWCREFGISVSVVAHRRHLGWSLDRALTTPLRYIKKASSQP